MNFVCPTYCVGNADETPCACTDDMVSCAHKVTCMLFWAAGTVWTTLPDDVLAVLSKNHALYEMNAVCKQWRDAAVRNGVKLGHMHWQRMMDYGFSISNPADVDTTTKFLMRRGDSVTLECVMEILQSKDRNNCDRVARQRLLDSIDWGAYAQIQTYANTASEEELIKCFKLFKERLERTQPLPILSRGALERAIKNATVAGMFHVVRFWVEQGYLRLIDECLEAVARNDEDLTEAIATIITDRRIHVHEHEVQIAVQAAAKANKANSVRALLSIGGSVYRACLGAAEGDHVELLRELMPVLVNACVDTPEGRRASVRQQHAVLLACIPGRSREFSRTCIEMLLSEMHIVPDLLILQHVAAKGHAKLFTDLYTAATAHGVGVSKAWLTRMLCTTPSPTLMQVLVELGADPAQLVLAPAQRNCTRDYLDMVNIVFTEEVAATLGADMWEKAMRRAILQCNTPCYVAWLLERGAPARYEYYEWAANEKMHHTYSVRFELMAQIMDLIQQHSIGEDRVKILQHQQCN
jgi:hypothetical protein